MCSKLREQADDYKGIMSEALADRLAEAFAELLHYKMRTELWGYAPDETMDVEEMLKVKARYCRAHPTLRPQTGHFARA
jgi:5-methyltetrahydrofolate--homocysteine methyltransferase